MLDVNQLRELVIAPTLARLGKLDPKLNSKAAVELLVGTAIAESRLTYLRQLPAGPALGLWQMEPATHRDHRRWLNRDGREALRRAIDDHAAPNAGTLVVQLTWNLRYACAMARIHYWRRPTPMPEAGDIVAMSKMWKRDYNTELGAGDPKEWVRLYRRYA